MMSVEVEYASVKHVKPEKACLSWSLFSCSCVRQASLMPRLVLKVMEFLDKAKMPFLWFNCCKIGSPLGEALNLV